MSTTPAPNPIQTPQSPVPIQTPFSAKTSTGVSWPWINWFRTLRDNVNKISNVKIPGPYANDAAAAAGGVAVGSPYYVTGSPGWVVVRIT